MYCSNCGTEVKGSYCENCGKPVEENALSNKDSLDMQNTTNMQTNTDMNVNSNIPNVPKKKKKSGCATVFLVFLVMMCGSLIFGTYQMSKNPEKYNNEKADKNEKSQTLSKKKAGSIDKKIWKYAINVMKVNNNVMNQMTSYTGGTLSDIELYETCKEGVDYLRDAWGNFPDYENKDAKAYGKSVKDYILFEQTLLESIMKYLDTKKTSDLSKVEGNIGNCNQAVGIVSSNRGVFLGLYNFSDDEIKKLASKMDKELAE